MFNSVLITPRLYSEAVLQRCSWEKVFWKYAANLQENTHAEVRFGLSCKQLYWNRTSARVCSPVNLPHIFRTTFLKNTSGWLLLKIFFCENNNFGVYGLFFRILVMYYECYIWYHTKLAKGNYFSKLLYQTHVYTKKMFSFKRKKFPN